MVNLPSVGGQEAVHSYGHNSFQLHGLPSPRPGHVLGMLGTNGIGKSTALGILAGRIVPNLGKANAPPGWEEVIKRFRGSDLQAFMKRLSNGNLRVERPSEEDMNVIQSRQLGHAVSSVAGCGARCKHGYPRP